MLASSSPRARCLSNTILKTKAQTKVEGEDETTTSSPTTDTPTSINISGVKATGNQLFRDIGNFDPYGSDDILIKF